MPNSFPNATIMFKETVEVTMRTCVVCLRVFECRVLASTMKSDAYCSDICWNAKKHEA